MTGLGVNIVIVDEFREQLNWEVAQSLCEKFIETASHLIYVNFIESAFKSL